MHPVDSSLELIYTPEILGEDGDVLAINKPAGLVVHPDGRNEERTLVDWILETHPEMREIGESWTSDSGEVLYRPGIVHRLDRETSGVMVLAKSQKIFLKLKKQFQERTTHKVYHTIVHGRLKSDWGVIDVPIGRNRKDFRKRHAGESARGEMRDAVTEYIVLAKTADYSYLEVRPKTGRTHQIRVHMKHIRHPIVRDAKYAPSLPPALSFDRVALHARSLTLAPLGPERPSQTYVAPLPADFLAAIKLLGITLPPTDKYLGA